MSAIMWMSLLLPALTTGCAEVEPVSRLERVDEAVTDGGLYTLSLTPEPDPPVAGPAALGLRIIDADGADVEGASIALDVWMPDHGHGVSQPPIVSDEGGGEYTAEWTYSMPGYWELTVEVSGPGGDDNVVVAYDVR